MLDDKGPPLVLDDIVQVSLNLVDNYPFFLHFAHILKHGLNHERSRLMARKTSPLATKRLVYAREPKKVQR